MRYHHLDLNLLYALKVLLSEKSVTRAADVVCVTQSAMSGILSRLREFFEDPLIVQVGRKMELTPLAEGLLEPVSDLLTRIDATVAARPMFDPAQSRRHFSFVVSDYVGSVLLQDVFSAVHHDAPDITFEIRQPSENTANELDMGEVDFIIHPELFRSQTQPAIELFRDNYVVVVDRANPDIGDTISLEQYVAAGHVSFQTARSSLPMFETWFNRQHGVARRVEVTVPSFHMLPLLVANTGRLATLHARFAEQCLEYAPVRIVKPLFEIPDLVELLQWHKYRDQDPGSLWLRERIIAVAQAMPPLGSLTQSATGTAPRTGTAVPGHAAP